MKDKLFGVLQRDVYKRQTCNHDITDEEMMYLTVHIKRVITR